MFGRKKAAEAPSQPHPATQSQTEPQPMARPEAQAQPQLASTHRVEPVDPVAPPAGPPPHPGAPQQPGAAPALSPEEAQRRAVIVVRQSVAFAQMVTMLMRSGRHRQLAISDLEWLIVPPLMLGQFAVAEAKAQADGPSTPVAMVLWATVSPEVDQRLSADLANPIRLRPEEWRCGETLWLIDAVGEPRVLAGLLKQITETAFAGRILKVRQSGADGKVVVAALGGAAPAAPAPA